MFGRKNGYGGSNVAATAVIARGVRIGKECAIGFGAVIYPDTRIGDHTYIGDYAVIGRPTMRPTKGSELNAPVRIGVGSVIGAHAVLYEGVKIDDRVLIGDGAKIRERCHIHDDCIVGSNCTFQRDVIMLNGSRVIDLSHITNDVIIGVGAFVSTGVLTMDDNSFNQNAPGDPTLRPPYIGAHTSIGGGAILLPGTVVNDHAVVAAGAVVTKDVQSGRTVYGVPAKEKHDIGYDGQPGAPSHALLHTAPAFSYEGQE